MAWRRPVGDATAMPPITAAVWDDAHYTSRPIEPYRPRAAEHTVLHRIVREHLATFLAVEEGAGGVPTFVAREFRQSVSGRAVSASYLLAELRTVTQSKATGLHLLELVAITIQLGRPPRRVVVIRREDTGCAAQPAA